MINKREPNAGESRKLADELQLIRKRKKIRRLCDEDDDIHETNDNVTKIILKAALEGGGKIPWNGVANYQGKQNISDMTCRT